MTLEEAVLKAVRDVLVPAMAPIPVYDEPPQDAALPLISVYGYQMRPSDTLDSHLLEHVITLVVVTNYEGRREVLAALGAIRLALHDVRLVLDEHAAVSCRMIEATTARIEEQGVVSTQGMVQLAILASDDD